MWLNGLAARPARTPTEIVLVDRDDHLIGRLRFRACQTCRAGRILDIWVCDSWRHQGLGRELVRSLLTHRPGYRWTTTLQTRDGRAFFLAMAQESTVILPHGSPLCCHLMGSIRRTRQGLLDRWSPR
ncbi:GNAT family N-acetyltransferase [Streptomyces sp. NPDC000888]